MALDPMTLSACLWWACASHWAWVGVVAVTPRGWWR